MGRPKTYDREEVLERALLLFWQKGSEGAHLQELVTSGKSSREIDQGMIDKYGAQVLLSEPPDESPSGNDR